MPASFAEEVLEELRTGAREWLDGVDAEQRPRVEQAARDLAMFTELAITRPEERERHHQNIRHILNTLESEAALASVRAAQQLRQAIARVLVRAAGFAISAI